VKPLVKVLNRLFTPPLGDIRVLSHIFTTPEKEKRNDLWYEAKVNAIVPSEPQYMHWSEAAITWGREDHPHLIPSPREYALVLDPTVCSDTHTCRFSRMLIDGGSSINPYTRAH
jgi:hypothetical protein